MEEGFLRYYMGVGRMDRVTPKDIVGAIAGEGNISSSNIGRIKLFDRFSTVELPETLPQEVLDILSGMTIRGNDSKFRLMTDEPPTGPAPGTRPRASREDRRSFHRDRKFEGGKPFENRKARREKMFGDRIWPRRPPVPQGPRRAQFRRQALPQDAAFRTRISFSKKNYISLAK